MIPDPLKLIFQTNRQGCRNNTNPLLWLRICKNIPYFSSQASSCGDAWSVQADLPTSPDHPPHGPHDEALLPACLWNTLTVSYEDQKFDRVVFPHSSKHPNNYDSFSQSSLFSTHLSPPLLFHLPSKMLIFPLIQSLS